MHIDERAKHCQNAEAPMDETVEGDLNITLRTVIQRLKQPIDNVPMLFGTVTSPSFPKKVWMV
jgi:hypothetical protein